MVLRVFRGLLGAGIALAVFAGAARAGEYHVYSCRTPGGEVAPADGWSGSVAAGGAFDDYAVDTCGEGGGLVAALGDQTFHGAEIDRATWAFGAPEGESLVAASLWRAGYVDGQAGENATYQLWMNGPDEDVPFDECIYAQGCRIEGDRADPLTALNRVTLPADLIGASLSVNANCGVVPGHICQQITDPNGYAAAIYVYAADLTLEQNAGPHASNVSGDLASAPTVQGASDVAFDATDPGSGVYEALFSVDGAVVQRTVLDDNGGRCRDVGQTTDGLTAFLYVQPCEQSVSVDVPFDTTKLANGAHHVVVSVIDAAGNAAPVLDREVTIANPPAPGTPGRPNGTGASTQAALSLRWQGTRRASMLSAYGRAQTLHGRLTGPGGAPISGASIDVRATPSYAGARTVTMASPTTGTDGSFSVRLAAGASSRVLRIAYRAHLGDALPVVTRTLRLKVRAGIVLSVSPHTASVGSSIHFAGRLSGGPIPAGGKALVLEARSPGSAWIEFKVIHTNARGRYGAAYRFKFPGPADYSFRARAEAESDYPFVAGASNVVAVHER
jgi:hypothetical protein